jgi:hypothetical protein
MNFPLTPSEISLWLAVTAIILLITSELIYSLPEISARMTIDKKRFRIAALGVGIAFLATVVMRIFYPF